LEYNKLANEDSELILNNFLSVSYNDEKCFPFEIIYHST